MPGHHPLPVKRSWVRPAITGSVVFMIVAAGAAAASESHTVTSFWRGLWWSISLITTVGFLGEPPRTAVGAVLSVILMVMGFLLMALVSASLASLFVRQEEAPHEAREESVDAEVVILLRSIDQRLKALEANAARDVDCVPAGQDPGLDGRR